MLDFLDVLSAMPQPTKLKSRLKYCYSHFRVSTIQKFLLLANHGANNTSISWSLHFEIDFVDTTVAADPAADCDDSIWRS